jgi:hypothetical protein
MPYPCLWRDVLVPLVTRHGQRLRERTHCCVRTADIARVAYRRTAATALPASAKSAPATTRLMVLRTLMLPFSAKTTPAVVQRCHLVIPEVWHRVSAR